MPCRRRRGVVVSASARVGGAAASPVRREPDQILYGLAPKACKCSTVRSGGRFPIKGMYWPLRPFDDPESRLRRRCALGLDVEGRAGRLSSVEKLQVRHTAGVDLVGSQECAWTTAAVSASRLCLHQTTSKKASSTVLSPSNIRNVALAPGPGARPRYFRLQWSLRSRCGGDRSYQAVATGAVGLSVNGCRLCLCACETIEPTRVRC